jgi:hypothetical protein
MVVIISIMARFDDWGTSSLVLVNKYLAASGACHQ